MRILKKIKLTNPKLVVVLVHPSFLKKHILKNKSLKNLLPQKNIEGYSHNKIIVLRSTKIDVIIHELLHYFLDNYIIRAYAKKYRDNSYINFYQKEVKKLRSVVCKPYLRYIIRPCETITTYFADLLTQVFELKEKEGDCPYKTLLYFIYSSKEKSKFVKRIIGFLVLYGIIETAEYLIKELRNELR